MLHGASPGADGQGPYHGERRGSSGARTVTCEAVPHGGGFPSSVERGDGCSVVQGRVQGKGPPGGRGALQGARSGTDVPCHQAGDEHRACEEGEGERREGEEHVGEGEHHAPAFTLGVPTNGRGSRTGAKAARARA